MEQFGRYELRRRLGVGGMAEVYEAVAIAEHGVEKPLVIKRILEEHSRDPSFRAMFIDEARIAMRLNHPNVVQVFDFGQADDRYFLAMELVRGKDLAEVLSRTRQDERRLPAEVVLFVIGEVAKGLDHAHRLTGSDGRPIGLVHRDVSPQNLLLSTEGAVKIGDFGIAKFRTRADLTRGAIVRGKVRYMSPEQADSLPLDGRSDLFSLGVVLYEMLTGSPAFDGRTDLDILDAVRACRPRPMSEIASVPAGIDRIVGRLLARDPKERFARGNDLQRELETYAVQNGLRATSGALAEQLLSLFPELERTSSPHEKTTIRRLPEASKGSGEVTRIRRVVEKDGMPVFVSETGTILLDPVSGTRESGVAAFDVSTVGGLGVSGPVTGSIADPTVERTAPGAAAEATEPRAAARPEPTRVRSEPEEEPRTAGSVRKRRIATDRPPEPAEVTAAMGAVRAAAAPAGADEPTSRDEPIHQAEPKPREAEPKERDAGPKGRAPEARGRGRRTRVGADPTVIALVLALVAVLGVWLAWSLLPRGSGRPARTAAIPTATGRLVIQGRDGDRVTINGKRYPPLPQPYYQLPGGYYEVLVEGGSDEFSVVFGIDVIPNQTVTKSTRISR